MCVQNFDDSRGPAIRITYRISLRSSSLWDPRHPLLKVVMNSTADGEHTQGRLPPPQHLFVFVYVRFGTQAKSAIVSAGSTRHPFTGT